MSTAVEIRDVTVTLGRAPVVRNVSVAVERGEWVALIGPNGAGKTSLLRSVSGLVRFDGQIEIDGHQVASCSRRERARRVAFVPQIPVIPPGMTVSEYVLLGRTPHIAALASETRADRLAVRRALDRLDLSGFADRLLGSLSGGERQRVVLARALAQEASILLLDEPTSALDLGHQQQALELVERLRREVALTVVCAMHDLSLAGQYADRLLLLDHGRLVADGTPGEVLSERTIAHYYGARADVIDHDGGVFVLPRRGGI